MKKCLSLLFFISISTYVFGMEDNPINEEQEVSKDESSSEGDSDENNVPKSGYSSAPEERTTHARKERITHTSFVCILALETKLNELVHIVSNIQSKHNNFTKKTLDLIGNLERARSRYDEDYRTALNDTNGRLSALNNLWEQFKGSHKQSYENLEARITQLQGTVTRLQTEQEKQHGALGENIGNKLNGQLTDYDTVIQGLCKLEQEQYAMIKNIDERIGNLNVRLNNLDKIIDNGHRLDTLKNKNLTPWHGCSRYALQGVGGVLGAGLFATMVPSTMPLFLLPFAKVGIGAAAAKIGIGTTMGFMVLGASKYNNRYIEKYMNKSSRPTWGAWSQDTISLLAKPALYTFGACTIGLMAYQLRKNPIMLPIIS